MPQLVKECSACLQGFPRHALDVTHSALNKFDGPTNANFKLVKSAVRRFVDTASETMASRKQRKSPGLSLTVTVSQKALLGTRIDCTIVPMTCKDAQYVVPFGRNSSFVGRESIIDQLLQDLDPDRNRDECRRMALDGLGGIGKTQIALEIAFRLRETKTDCSIFWVQATDVASFERAYREIGRAFGVLRIDEDDADVKVLTRDFLSSGKAGKWLLILDNSDDVDILYGASNLASFLPFSLRGSILITTRNHAAAVRLAGKRSITIEPMSQTESLDLLSASLSDTQLIADTESALKLLSQLTYLPLAIKQASAYMQENQIPVTTYLEIYETSEEELIHLLSRDFQDEGRYQNTKNPIAATWSISFRQILKTDPLAADYLRFMSCLGQNDIPGAFLIQSSKSKEVEAIGILKAYAFITQNGAQNAYHIHPLVQLAARNWLRESGDLGSWVEKVVDRVAQEFPSPVHGNRDRWLKYLPHASQLLQLQEATNGRSEGSQLLHFNVGGCLRILGKYKEAELAFREVAGWQQETIGNAHPATLASMNKLAEVLAHQGRYPEAESMHRETLLLTEKALGKSNLSETGTLFPSSVLLTQLFLLGMDRSRTQRNPHEHEQPGQSAPPRGKVRRS